MDFLKLNFMLLIAAFKLINSENYNFMNNWLAYFSNEISLI